MNKFTEKTEQSNHVFFASTSRILKAIKEKLSVVDQAEAMIECKDYSFVQGSYQFDTSLSDIFKFDIPTNSVEVCNGPYGHFMEVITYKTNVINNDLKHGAAKMLADFRATGDYRYLFEYRKLLGELRALLINIYLKVKKIFRFLKLIYRKTFLLDQRKMFRKQIKMLSRNTDDEAHQVNVLSNFFYLNINYVQISWTNILYRQLSMTSNIS